ncbi:unnamed protein product [Moneuplotes crassus]|uniref:Uncharacterized protein n=1 Tax=Euplotes crassus TaxID=5936 RepID=A0AAD1X7H8_EUPCR|nr:unnamed protein product [Moneuplotes crassus]
MNSVPKITCDENISDEFLSEEVSSCRVPTSKKILENMSFKSMSMRKQTGMKKLSFNPRDASYCVQNNDLTHGLKENSNKQSYWSEEIKYGNINKPHILSSSAKTGKPRNSLKKEISSLLKVAAEIRSNKKSKSAFSKQKFPEPPQKRREPPICNDLTMRDVKPSV